MQKLKTKEVLNRRNPQVLKDLESKIQELKYRGYCIPNKLSTINTKAMRSSEEKQKLKKELENGRKEINDSLQT